MAMKTFNFADQGGGLVSDSNAFTLADNEWSDLHNVRIHNRAVSRMMGESSIVGSSGLTVSPRHIQFINGYDTNKFYYIIDNLGDTYRMNRNGVVSSRLTRGNSDSNRLSTGVQYQMNPMNGGYVLVINDGARTPEYITSVGSGTNTTQLTQIPGWNYGSTYTGVTAAVIRPFKYVLVAGNITQTRSSDNAIERNAGTIRVSNQATAGNLPTWDPTLSGADTADEFELSENGEIIDMVSLGDNLMIFTPNTIFALRLTGNTTTPVVVSKQLQGRGMLAQGCGQEFFGKLFIVGSEDIYVFQGGAATQSVADERVRDYFFDNLHSTHYENTFVVHNEREDTMEIYFPNLTSTGPCNEVLLWNYNHNNWTKGDVTNAYPGTYGPVRSIADSEFQIATNEHVVIATVDSDILARDIGDNIGGNPISWYLERRGCDVAPGSPGISKWNDSIYFLATGDGTFTVKVRATDTPGRPVDFNSNSDTKLATRTFTIDGDMSDLMVNPRVNGKFLNLRLEGTNNMNLHRYTVDYEESDHRSE